MCFEKLINFLTNKNCLKDENLLCNHKIYILVLTVANLYAGAYKNINKKLILKYHKVT